MKAVRYTLIFLVAAIGCGDGDSAAQLAAVSGKVTLDGSPLADVTVSFQPQATTEEAGNLQSYGKTDQDGQYTLEVVASGDSGAVVGMHKVQITRNLPEGEEEPDNATEEDYPNRLPARYNLESTLTFDVPDSGSDQANFELTSKK